MNRKVVVHSIAVFVLLFTYPAMNDCGGPPPQQRQDVVIKKFKKGGGYYLHTSSGRDRPVDSTTYRQCKAGDTYSTWVGCIDQPHEWR